MDELFTLEGALRWLVSAIGSGLLASWILSNWPWFQRLQDDLAKRLIALLSPAPIAVVAYLILLLFAYDSQPATMTLWAERIYGIMAGAIIGQIAHAYKKSVAIRKDS